MTDPTRRNVLRGAAAITAAGYTGAEVVGYMLEGTSLTVIVKTK